MLYTLLSENNVLVSFGWTKIWEICRICQRERGIDLESKANFSTLRYKLRYTFQLKRIEFSNAWFQGRNLNCIQPINTHHTYHRCGSRHLLRILCSPKIFSLRRARLLIYSYTRSNHGRKRLVIVQRSSSPPSFGLNETRRVSIEARASNVAYN